MKAAANLRLTLIVDASEGGGQRRANVSLRCWQCLCVQRSRGGRSLVLLCEYDEESYVVMRVVVYSYLFYGEESWIRYLVAKVVRNRWSSHPFSL